MAAILPLRDEDKDRRRRLAEEFLDPARMLENLIRRYMG
jgi:hypothetical protein